MEALQGFAQPPTLTRPYIRYWWPHGLVDPEEVRREVNQIADAGFGGIEVQDAHHSIDTGTDLDTEHHGWGSQPWIDAFTAALEVSVERGLAFDSAFGPSWPLALSTIVPDDEAAAKELVLGYDFTEDGKTYNGPVPTPWNEAQCELHNLTTVAVQAWRVDNSTSATANPVLIEADSMVDLTSKVVNNTVKFEPPDDATWLIYSAEIGRASCREGGCGSV